jgi:16S rRNA (guanine527-N7)-methyltransferase
LPVTAVDPRLQALNAGAEALGVPLTAGQAGALLAYADLIAQWNKVYNLTAVRDPDEMLTHHLLDSLAVVAPLRRQRDAADGAARPIKLLDVGAGAGLPGVVIAICCPDVAVTCVDTVAKKAAFVQQVAAALKLPNLRGHHARVETLTAGDFDVVSSRAFASLGDFTAWSGAALAPGREGDPTGAGLSAGIWLAMKGKHPAEEIAALPPGVEVFHVEQLTVPGLEAERCIVWMRKKTG